MSVSKIGIPFTKQAKDTGLFFASDYVVNGLSEEVHRVNYKGKLIYDSPKKLGKQIEYLGLSDYLYNHQDDAKVYLHVECLMGLRGYDGFRACQLYVQAKWMDLDTKHYHVTSSSMSQGEYCEFIKLFSCTCLEY